MMRPAELVPDMQNIIRRFTDTNATRFYIFLDDLHYLPSAEQPKLLDLVHGAVRDSDAWLKVAGIRHLTRWFQEKPPLGTTNWTRCRSHRFGCNTGGTFTSEDLP